MNDTKTQAFRTMTGRKDTRFLSATPIKNNDSMTIVTMDSKANSVTVTVTQLCASSLPFYLPLVAAHAVESFISTMLKDLKNCFAAANAVRTKNLMNFKSLVTLKLKKSTL